MEKTLEIENDVGVDISNEQNGFLQSTLGKVINFSVDTGLRAVLPDVIEDEVIDIKDTLINEGFSEAINETIDSAIDIGKSALGIITGNFESVSQAEKAVEKGGIIDGVSNVLDFTLDKVGDLGIISDKTISAIKKGKDVLLNNVSSDIKNEFESQNKNIEKLKGYTEDWKEAYNNQDFDKMEKNIKKVKSTLKKIMPIQNLISEAKQMENIHELIKNNGKNFNLSEEQLKLTEILK